MPKHPRLGRFGKIVDIGKILQLAKSRPAASSVRPGGVGWVIIFSE